MSLQNILLISFFALISCTISTAQTYKAYIKAGDKAYTKTDYYDAYSHFKTAMKIDSSDAILWYKLAKSAWAYNVWEEADYYYGKIEKAEETTVALDFYKEYGDLKKVLGQFDKAIQYYDKGNNTLAKEQCETARKIVEQPLDIKIKHLDKPVNTLYSDFAAQQVGGDLMYSTMRFKVKNKNGYNDYMTKLVRSKDNQKSKPLKSNFNQDDRHTANAFYTNNGNTVYYTQCNPKKVKGLLQCIIYMRKQVNGKWQTPIKLPEIINQEGFTATHPAVGYDSIAQKEVLFFVTNRTQEGILNVWKSEVLGEQEFTQPEPIFSDEAISNDNITPYFHTSTQTLYFSSKAYVGLGGYDIFKTKRTKTGWGAIQNVGYPLNSGANDVYFRWNDDGKTGFFSSTREGALSLTRGSCCYDIYAFEWTPPSDKEKPKMPELSEEVTTTTTESSDETKPIEPINGTIDKNKPITPETPNTTVTTRNKTEKGKPNTTLSPPSPNSNTTTKSPNTPLQNLNSRLPIALYFNNDQPNPKTLQTTTQLNYSETYVEYITQKNVFVQIYGVGFQQKFNDFFTQKVQQGHRDLEDFSDRLLQTLRQGQPLEVLIKGYTSPRASSDYNTNLAQRRIQSLRNYFNEYQFGQLLPYLNNGQLSITEIALGETTAASTISDKITDRRNSIYSVEASEERRVEILEVR